MEVADARLTGRSRPTIIQGGMGVGVSGWRLANAVSKTGQLGVVAGTGLDLVLAHRLQLGDPGGHMRRALAHFPIPDIAQRVLTRYYVPGGKDESARFKPVPLPTVERSAHLDELLVLGNFAEVFLAREGHDNPVGINYLQKILLPTLPSLFGAMLAGVGFVLMGAGIPKAIPGVLDRLSLGQPVELRIDVRNAAPDESFYTRFDPNAFCDGEAPRLTRPHFLAIIASNTMAELMVKKASGRVDGFIIEGPSAGGHNAPPRGRLRLGETNEPVYGTRDVPDLEAIGALGRPFWLAGSFADPEYLADARKQGAAGVQVGTAFAYCEESGFMPTIKDQVLALSQRKEARTFTDAVASPAGFPFKVLPLTGTMSEPDAFLARPKICDIGYLRTAYKKETGGLGWRCPSEPVEQYVRKGGDFDDTVDRKCVCNGLVAAIGLGHVRKDGYREVPMITSGDDVANVARFLAPGATSYRAADVIAHLLRGLESPAS